MNARPRQATRRPSRPPGAAATFARAALALALALPFAPGTASASPPDGSDAPPITLPDMTGAPVNTSALAPRSLVLIFGELDHDGARQACIDVLDVLTDPRLAEAPALPVFIVAQDAPDAELRDQAAKGRFPAVILHDRKREAFGAYRVLVVPTVVVVNGKGKVVHAMPGFLPRFKEILTDSLLCAAGKETPEQLARTIDAGKSQAPPSESVRADRLVHLGTELTRHSLYEMAEARFTEAIALCPGHAGAKLGLGDLMLRQGRLADAEPLYRSVLAADPGSLDAAMGIAAVQIRAGGDGVSKAEASLRSILEKSPTLPRAHFLLGQVYEIRGEWSKAAAEFRTSTELLLDR